MTPAAQQNSHVVIPPSIAPVLNEVERAFIGQCKPLEYRTISNRIVCDVVIDGNKYNDLVVCDCPVVILMWVQDASRKTVYRLCQEHGLKYNGHLERARKAVENHDVKRSGNSRRGWSVTR